MLTLTGERFRVCVQVRAQVQLGNVLFLSPLAAAVFTSPQSFIHTQKKAASTCRSQPELQCPFT